MKIFLSIYIFLSSFLAGSLIGQSSIHFERLKDKEGLSQEYIFCIHQDRHGFIWFGTWDGLNRYDGYQFDLIKPDPQNPHSLSTNCVTAIEEDSSGALWIGTNGGGLLKIYTEWYLNIYTTDEEHTGRINKYKDAFIQFRTNPEEPHSLSNNNITALCYDNRGFLWIGTYGGGINILNLKDTTNNKKFIQYNNSTKLSDNNISKILKDSDGNIWIGTNNKGIIKIPASDIKNGIDKISFTYYKHSKTSDKSLSSNNISSLYEDPYGNIWIGTNRNGLNLLTKENKKKMHPAFIHFTADPKNTTSLSNNSIKSIQTDQYNNLWIGTDNGLNKGKLPKKLSGKIEFNHFKHDPLLPTTISNNHIESLYKGHSGILWIGTYKGINKLDPSKKQFAHYQNIPENQNNLINNTVNAITEDHKDVLWIGTESGILTQVNQYNQKKHFFLTNGKAISFKGSSNQDKQEAILPSFLQNPILLSGTFVNAIIEDTEHNLWVGSTGLYKFDKNRKKAAFYHPEYGNLQSLSDWKIWTIYQDKAGEIWIGTSNGMDNYNKATNSFIHYRHNTNNAYSLSSNIIWCIFEDAQGYLWIGTESGLNKFNNYNTHKQKKPDPTDAIFKHYNHDQENPNSISSDRIWVIHQGPDKTMWIGTEGGGLNKAIKKHDTISHFITYNKNDGLPSNIICGIVEDNNQNLWISTSNGIAQFDIKNEKIKDYGINDGLQATKFRKGAYYKKDDKNILFGDLAGYTSFFPDSIRDNPVPPKVVITEFNIFNKSIPIGEYNGKTILTKPISVTDHIDLSYKDNIFSFEFVALHYSSPVENKYAYKMEGFEKQWNHTNYRRRFASYTDLPPGKYTFKVKAANSDGIWNEKGASLVISIKPPLWRTWWAYILYVIVLGLVIYAIFQYTIGKERLKSQLRLERVESAKKEELAQKAHEVDQMKLRFFTNISHEFRTPLTLILGPLENLAATFSANKAINKQIKIIQRNAQHLLRLINQLMDFRKLDTGSMKLKVQEGDIVNFLKRIKSSFDHLAEQRQIKLTFKSAFQTYTLWFDPDVIEKVFYNLLSNAFKFVNNKGKISIKIESPADEELKNKATGNYVKITVSDNGIGIDPQQLKKIFDRFYQIENPQSDQKTGTGIGLALTKELVEMHHGYIDADSQQNKYTQFTIYLPEGHDYFEKDEIIPEAYEDNEYRTMITEDKPEEQCDIEEEMIEKSSKPILLIVEDNKDLCMYINESLKDYYSVVEASNGRKGYDKAIEIIPDIVITDIMMPDMDGFQLCDKLKKNEMTMHIPIIILTALTSEQSKIQGLETGADDYITKPFSTNILKVKVNNLIESRKKLKALYNKQITSEEDHKEQADPFLQKAIETIERNIENPDYGVEAFASEMGLSRAQLFRKIKGMTDQTVSEFIRNIRLKKAAIFLKNNIHTINEIIYKVGFNSQSYFNKCFRELYGKSPGEYTSAHNNN